MPNWVSNKVEISHDDQSVINEVFDTLTHTPENGEENDDDRRVTFKKLAPVPEILDRVEGWPRYPVAIGHVDDQGVHHTRPATEAEIAEIEATGFPNGYEWRLHHWGCKWDAGHSTATKGDRSISLHFDTPWAPPEAFVEAIRERWPEADVGGGWVEEGHESCGPF